MSVEKPKPGIHQLSYFHMNLYHTVLFCIHVELTSYDLSSVLINSFLNEFAVYFFRHKNASKKGLGDASCNYTVIHESTQLI